MFKVEQVCALILAEFEKEVTSFFDSVAQDKPEAVSVESMAKEIGLRLAALLIEKGFQLYGNGHLGQCLPCNCPQPQSGMNFIRYDRKTFITVAGPVEATSAYYHCKVCNSSRWPAFQRLGLGPSDLSEGARRLAAFAGAAEGGFQRSSRLLKHLSGIDLSKNTLQRETEKLGAEIKQLQQQELQQAVALVSKPAPASNNPTTAGRPAQGQLLHLAIDGTGVKTQTGKHEVKSAAFYKVKIKKGEETRATEISYVSSFNKVEEFGEQVWREAIGRGALGQELVVVLGDGAAWIWNLYATHFPYNRIEVLDYYHASEHLATAAKAYFGEGSAEATGWHRKQAKLLLKKGGVGKVLKELEKLKDRRIKVRKVVADTIRYFENNLGRMSYFEYRKRGYHIGSGLAESACKHVVGERLKKSGMTNWKEAGAEAVLQVRVAIENERLDEYCDKILSKRFREAA